MAYTEEADVRLIANTNSVTQLADDDGDGTADTGVIATAIAWSDGQLYGRIKRRYSSYTPASRTPSTTDATLRHFSAQLAFWHLCKRQHRLPITLRDEALDWAKEVGSDEGADLDVAATNLPTSTTFDRLREYREKGAIRDYGEPVPGDVTDTDDNDFLTETSGSN